MRVETGLSRDHVSHWTETEALRELIANGLDGEASLKEQGYGKFTVKLDGNMMTLTNEGVVLEPRIFAIGLSTSRGRTECIGQFGEGLPLALLVLAREGRKVVLRSGECRWEPKIVMSEALGVPVLEITTRRVKYQPRFVIELSNVSSAEYLAWTGQFLMFNPAYNNDYVVNKGTSCEILLHPDEEGLIYVKGVFITRSSRLSIGVNLGNMQLNRDRSIIDLDKFEDQVETVLPRLGELSKEQFSDTARHRIGQLWTAMYLKYRKDEYSITSLNRRLLDVLLERSQTQAERHAHTATVLRRDAAGVGWAGPVHYKAQAENLGFAYNEMASEDEARLLGLCWFPTELARRKNEVVRVLSAEELRTLPCVDAVKTLVAALKKLKVVLSECGTAPKLADLALAEMGTAQPTVVIHRNDDGTVRVLVNVNKVEAPQDVIVAILGHNNFVGAVAYSNFGRALAAAILL